MDYLSVLPGALNLALIWCIAGIGVYITFKILDIPDLTVDASFATGALVCAAIISNGGHYLLGMALGFVAGLLCGLITGLLYALLGIPPILSGILVQLALWSVNLIITNNRNTISISVRNYDLLFSQMHVYDALWKIAIIVGVIILLLYLFFGTQLGCSIRATGNNQKMSKAHGINTKRNIVIALAISNGLVAFAGALFAQYQGQAYLTIGQGTIVTALSAIVVGGLVFSKFAKNFAVRLSSVVFGSIVYFIIYQTALFFDVETYLMRLFTSIMVAIFLGIPYIKRTYIGRIQKWHANNKIKRGGE